MRKVLKYGLWAILGLIVVLILFVYLYPRVAHPECYAGGGEWAAFPTTGVDECGFYGGGGEAITDGCDCGPLRCWNGTICVPNPVFILEYYEKNKTFEGEDLPNLFVIKALEVKKIKSLDFDGSYVTTILVVNDKL